MTTAVQLAQRRRAVARARTRKRPRRIPPAAPPRGAIVAYAALLTRLGSAIDGAVSSALARARVVRRDGPADGDAPIPRDTIREIVAAIQRRARAVVSTPAVERAVAAIAAQVDAWSGEQTMRQLGTLAGIDPADLDADTRALRERFRRQNLALIRSMAQRKVTRVRQILVRSGAGGRVERIARDIEAETGATPARAALIARDQVLSLNAQVTQARHEAAGITQYVWSTSNDERVRASHRELAGQTFSYADPPVVDEKSGRRANPGQDFQCRCVALPVVPGLDTEA